MKYLIFLVLLFVQFILPQGLSVSGNIDAKIGDGTQYNDTYEKLDFEYTELLLNLNAEWKNISAWLQYEYSNPPEYGRSLNTVRRFLINYDSDSWSIEAGDIYRSWDRGLILSQFEDQQINFDNSVRGVGLLLNKNNLEIDIFAGSRKQYQSTPFNTDLRKHDESVNNRLFAGRVGYSIGILQNGLSLLMVDSDFHLISRGTISEDQSNSKNILIGYSAEVNSDTWDLAFDAVFKKVKIDPELYFLETNTTDFSIDSITREEHQGYGIYGIINKYLGNWSLTIDYKKYNFAVMDPTMRISYPYPEGALIYQNPPLTFLEHSSTLLNRNIHQMDRNDEVGYQITLSGALNQNANVLLNYNSGSSNTEWSRTIGEYAWQRGNWTKDQSSVLMPIRTPGANPYSEIYGEIVSYLFDDKLSVRLGISKASQSLLVLENIKTVSYDSLSYEFVDALTLPLDLSYSFSNGYSLEMKYQWQQLKKGIRSEVKNQGIQNDFETSFFYERIDDITNSKKYQNISILQLGIQKSPVWGINFAVEWDKYYEFGVNSENIDLNPIEELWKSFGFETDLTWLSIDLLLYISSKYRFNLFYGSEKGGLQCRNGVCKIIQPFNDGLRVGFTTYF